MALVEPHDSNIEIRHKQANKNIGIFSFKVSWIIYFKSFKYYSCDMITDGNKQDVELRGMAIS